MSRIDYPVPRMYYSRVNNADADLAPAAGGFEMLGLLEAAHALEERVDGALDSLGLSMSKYMALKQLIAAGGSISLSALAERRKCVRSNITQLVDRLEADGFVERVDDPEDRRAIRAQVTKLGTERFAAGTAALNAVQADFAGHISEKDRSSFLKVLSGFRTL